MDAMVHCWMYLCHCLLLMAHMDMFPMLRLANIYLVSSMLSQAPWWCTCSARFMLQQTNFHLPTGHGFFRISTPLFFCSYLCHHGYQCSSRCLHGRGWLHNQPNALFKKLPSQCMQINTRTGSLQRAQQGAAIPSHIRSSAKQNQEGASLSHRPGRSICSQRTPAFHCRHAHTDNQWATICSPATIHGSLQAKHLCIHASKEWIAHCHA